MKLAYGLLQLTISDNGIGIKPDEVNTYLLGKSTKHSGLGIGLSSAKEYMKKIGGELSIASNQNQGTSITLTFKIK
jgi:signal transduction histidine kinase